MSITRRWWAVGAIGLAIFLIALDITVVSLALPVMARSFQLSASLMSMVNLAYSLPMTLLILPIGVALHRFRPLTLFLASVGGFGCASLLCALAPNFILLLLGRALQGSCAAVIATQGTALAAVVVVPTERGRAMGIVGSLAPLGSVTGPGLGGLLLTRWSWPAVFLINIPVCLLAVLLACFCLKEVRMTATPAQLRGIGSFGMLLRSPGFTWGLLAMLCNAAIGGALYYLLPFNLELLQHVSASLAGVTLLCMPLGMVVMGPVSGYLTDRYGVRSILITGASLTVVALLLLLLVVGAPTTIPNIAWRLFFAGLAFSYFLAPVQTLLMGMSSREMMGTASALMSIARSVGFVCGPLTIGFVWVWVSDLAQQMTLGMLFIVGIAVLNLYLCWRALAGAKPLREARGSETGVLRH